MLITSTAAFAQVTHLGSDLPIIGDGSLAAQLVKVGNDAINAGNVSEAKANYQNALVASPFDENATIGLARCAVSEGNLKAAIGYYQSAINGHHEEDNIDIQTEYILVLTQTGDGPEAASRYNHLLELCKKGRVITPMEIAPQNFRLDGSDYAPVKLQAMVHLIRALNASNDDDKRISSEMQKAASLAPDSAIVYFYEGIFLNREHKSGAKAAFQQALSLDSGSNAKVINKWITLSK